MNEMGCITIGVPGGPCVCIEFDLINKKSSITYHKTRPNVEYKVIEKALLRMAKGHVPGSHSTARLRKKRYKAVMSAVPKLEALGLIKSNTTSIQNS